MMKKWIVWTKDLEDFQKWSNRLDEFFLVITEGTPTCHSDDVAELPDHSVLVINGHHKEDLDDTLPDDSDWYANARLWAHLGGVTGKPEDSDWERFFGDIKKSSESLSRAFGLIGEKRGFSFQSDPKALIFDVAKQVSAALGKKEHAKSGKELLALLENAWGTAEKKSLTAFERRITEALFPLYVDLISPLEPVDLAAAWKAAESNLEFVLSRESVSEREEKRHSVADLIALLHKQATEDFQKHFKELSKIYSCHLDSDRKEDSSTPFAIGATP
uniref:Uncharacterized protein n=1 Tax=Candidatus Kentrum sp. FM TaxID=2126340 RepID=A0A450VVN4_9GAMM|nr:MAG: hypothetical protein BECKFM1743A_GA0114220_100842 [Candidatus Kentron sp. FM]VFJ51161.1 MAG: hypothetical protein BECKFM1743C_GA0114222_100942 [Candidatus Kentron sp. FM]VFK08844.1 MAG: hypothetical protein BECKFM1743B_GA0114221_100832 [Candidatus Kentron sp. FM]